ncbi:MAG: acetamidase/formamidase family protein [Spirochaetaceae bacterium]|nr:MAG: acetamidase/formamidase family protein [Spirochaetaceae bacterium]
MAAIQNDIPIVKRNLREFYFAGDIEPVISIRSGQTIIVETEDANAGLIQTENDVYSDFSKLFEKAGGCNPVTGPIYVEDASPGDCLVVKLESITVEQRGYTSIFPTLGALQSSYTLQPSHGSVTKICEIQKDHFIFSGKNKEISIPVEPFIGTISTAPVKERIYSFYHGKDYCGNIDCPDLKAGTTVVLPVNVEGGLLSVGDIHARQGDGEITGCALEIRGKVQITVECLPKEKAQFCEWPQVNASDWIGSIGCPLGGSLDDAVRVAYLDLIERMHAYYGFDKLDAYQLLNLVGRVTVGQVLEPLYTCVAKIDRKYLG